MNGLGSFHSPSLFSGENEVVMVLFHLSLVVFLSLLSSEEDTKGSVLGSASCAQLSIGPSGGAFVESTASM
jgi:hypothetical protein